MYNKPEISGVTTLAVYWNISAQKKLQIYLK